MTAYEFDDDPARFSSRLAVAVAVLAVLLLGLGTGPGLLGQAPEVVLGLLGAAALVHGAVGISGSESRQRAAGSVWFVVGVLAVVGASAAYKPSLAAAAVTTFGTLAVLVFGLSAAVGIDEALVRSLGGALSRSLVVLVAAAVLTAAVQATLLRTTVAVVVLGYGVVVLAGPFVSFVALQLEALLLVVLVDRAGAALDGWLPERRFDRRESALRRVGVRVGDVPRGVYVLLGLEVLVALTGAGRVLFLRLLARTGPFGTVVYGVLNSWVPHALLGAGILLFGGVVLARLAQRVVVRWLGREPPKTLGYAAGGAAVSVVVGVLTAIPPVVSLVDGLVAEGSALDVAFGTYGMGTTFLALAVVALCAVLVALPVCMFLVWDETARAATGGARLGGALLLAASLAAGFGDAPAVVAFVGVAATLAAWDLSVNATLVGREVGRTAETRRGEVIHAAGVLVVGVVAVLVTLLGVEFIGAAALTLDVPRWRALGALTLLLVALLCFVGLASDDASDAGDGEEDRGGGRPWYARFDDL